MQKDTARQAAAVLLLGGVGLCLIATGSVGLQTTSKLLGLFAPSKSAVAGRGGLVGWRADAASGQAKMMVLCEGHFLDTATGIPETDYSTLSHPDTLPGDPPAIPIPPPSPPPLRLFKMLTKITPHMNAADARASEATTSRYPSITPVLHP